MDSQKEFLILAFVGDNHLNNVCTLQSIFKQTFNGMRIVLCNNSTNAFQCERLILNITDHTPATVHQIQIDEESHPSGEASLLKRMLTQTDSDYVIVLHAGDQFLSDSFLDTCALMLGSNRSIEALAVSAKEYSADFKHLERTLFAEGSSFRAENDGSNKSLRDCMFVYRKSTLQSVLGEREFSSGSIWGAVMPVLFTRGTVGFHQNIFSCKFQEGPEENTPLPSALGNAHLINIEKRLQNGAGASRDRGNRSSAFSLYKASGFSPEQKRIDWLYRHSRLQKMKTDLLITLLLVVLASILYVHQLIPPVAYVVFGIAFLSFVWLVVMFFCNMYFKKHPERLVSTYA